MIVLDSGVFGEPRGGLFQTSRPPKPPGPLPCALARYCKDLGSPRKILSALFEGGIREIATHKRTASWCGEGGMLPVYRPDLSKRVSQLLLEEAQETGATLLATGCPRCQDAFTRAIDPARRNSRWSI